MRLSKMSWFVSGEQFNNSLLKLQAEKIIDLQDGYKSQYFAITELNVN